MRPPVGWWSPRQFRSRVVLNILSFSHDDFEEEDADWEEEDLREFSASIVTDKIGDANDPTLAKKFTDRLHFLSDRSQIRDALQEFPTPENVAFFKVSVSPLGFAFKPVMPHLRCHGHTVLLYIDDSRFTNCLQFWLLFEESQDAVCTVS